MKRFLKRNEIYFTTLSSLLLGIMAIVVSYNSNRIAKEQSKINYHENTPDFHFSRNYISDSTGNINGLRIGLNKSRGMAKNISLKIRCYVHLEMINQKNEQIEKYVPLINYFNSSYGSRNNDGDIKLIEGRQNLKNFNKLIKILESELLKKDYLDVIIEDLLIAEITYNDFVNERRIEYYDVSQGEGVLLINDDPKVELFKNIKSSKQSITLGDLNDGKIKKYIDLIEI